MTKSDIVRQLIRTMPGAPARTLAQRLRQDYPQVFPSVENARKSVLYVLGTNGKKNRKNIGTKNDLFREPRKAGWKPELPPSAAEPWEPIVLPTPSVALSLSDLHIPYHDKRAIEAAVKFAKRRHKITDLVINGDFSDFYQISRFGKNPLKRSMGGELKDQLRGLEWLRSEFRRQRKWFKLGNHDVRWDHYVWNHAPALADVEHIQLHKVLEFDRLGFNRVNDEPIMAGKLPILHGHELGKGMQNPVGPARTAFMKTLHSVLIGHHHRTNAYAESNIWHHERMAWSQGCLCDMSPEYARVNKWNQGFAVVEVASDGTYSVFNYRIGGDYAIRQS